MFLSISRSGKPSMSLGRHDEAVKTFERGLLINEDHPGLLDTQGDMRGGVGRFADAAASFGEAIGLEPGNPEPWYNLGLALEKAGRPEDALNALEGFLTLIPGEP